jgi:O-antigen/teichoic acid export membrane protein
LPIFQRSSKAQSTHGHADKPFGRPRVVSLGARSFASIADQGAAAAITFLSSVFVGRLLGAEALGIFAMTSVLVMGIRQAQAGAVLDPMSVFGPRRPPAEQDGYLGFVVALQVLWVGGIALAAAVTATVLWFAAWIDANGFYAVIASLVFANVITLQYLFRRQFYVDEMPQRALVQSLMFLALCSAAFASYAATDRVSVVGVYLVLTGCSLAVCFVHAKPNLARASLPSRNEQRRYLSEHWRYGSWTLLTVPLSLVCYQGYFLLSGSILSVEEAGYLKAADALIAPFSQLAIGVSLMFVPIAARRFDAMAPGVQRRYGSQFCAAILSIAAVYAAVVFLFGAEIIDLIFGQRLSAAGAVVHTMALVPLLIAIGVPAGIMLAATRRPDLRLAAYGVAAATSVIVGFPLVGKAGLYGAAWGLVASQAALSAGLWFALFCGRKAAASAAAPARSDG